MALKQDGERWMRWLSSGLGGIDEIALKQDGERWTRWLSSGLGEMGLMRDRVDERWG
jgi:hypothetical protein